MKQVTLIIDGKKYESNAPVKLSQILSLEKDYDRNPIALASVNGRLASLMEPIGGNAEVETIPLISPFGKRAYRKTLCFLLSYASALLHPELSLIIGHSLGDGFYFRYRNGEKPDTDKLIAVMKDAIAEDLSVELVDLTEEEALDYASKHKLKETAELIRTMNRSSFRFAQLGSCLEMYYEPLLPSMKYLKLWELREYEDGLLLRYPQSRSPYSLLPFTDNPLLFSVFKENKEYASILGISSIGELNAKIARGEIQKTILLAEALQRRRISDISRMIKQREKVKAVFIAGPSSSGKTTFSLKLSDELRVDGYTPLKISLDDYYLTTDKIPLDENGERDYEVLESLDLDLLGKQLTALLNGEEVHLASFSFKEKKTTFREKSVRMDENTILVVEGIHGLNPQLTAGFDESMIFRIYISALTQINLDTRSRISTTDNRILRRMIRDSRTRGISPTETLSRWPSVERGEKNNIFPFQNNADSMINSALSYELAALVPYAVPLLRSVRKESGEPYIVARRLLAFLDLILPMPDDMIPPDSILREFIGGSIYGAI